MTQYNDDEEDDVHLNIAPNFYFLPFFIMTDRNVKTTGVRTEICFNRAE